MIRLSVLLIVAVGASGCLGTVRLSRQQLQERLDRKFPITQRATMVSVTLEQPQVMFPGEDGQLGLRLTVKGEGPGLVAQVDVQAEGRVTYDEAQGAFFLQAPRRITLKNLRAGGSGDVQRVGGPVESVIGMVVPPIVEEVLNSVPVYVLDPSKDEESKVKNHLKAVRVRDEALIIELK